MKQVLLADEYRDGEGNNPISHTSLLNMSSGYKSLTLIDPTTLTLVEGYYYIYKLPEGGLTVFTKPIDFHLFLHLDDFNTPNPATVKAGTVFKSRVIFQYDDHIRGNLPGVPYAVMPEGTKKVVYDGGNPAKWWCSYDIEAVRLSPSSVIIIGKPYTEMDY